MFPAQDILGFFGTYLCWMFEQHFGEEKQAWWYLLLQVEAPWRSPAGRAGCPVPWEGQEGQQLSSTFLPQEKEDYLNSLTVDTMCHKQCRAWEGQLVQWRDFQDFNNGVLGLSENIQDFSTDNAQECNEEAFAGMGQQKNLSKTTSWGELLIRTNLFFIFSFWENIDKSSCQSSLE